MNIPFITMSAIAIVLLVHNIVLKSKQKAIVRTFEKIEIETMKLIARNDELVKKVQLLEKQKL